jgi:anti-sigma factor RsiW
MFHPWTDRLSDYLDGGMRPKERAALEAHLASCPDCARALAELSAVVARAGRLPARAPEADLWPGIAARLKPRRAPRSLGTVPLGGWRVSFTVPQLAAAALVLTLLSSGTMWLALNRRPAPLPAGPQGQLGAPARGAESANGTDATVADFGFARYDAAIADLERVLALHRAELDPATVRVIEDNLRIIDRATAQARRALAADPANPYLNGHLADQMRRKVELLRQVAALFHA